MKAVTSTIWGLSAELTENVNRRTQHSMLFKNPGGSNTALLSSNLHYEARPGEWEPQDYNFALQGSNHVVDQHWFHTQVMDDGISIAGVKTGIGVKWLLPRRATVTQRAASIAGKGVVWSYLVGPKRLKVSGFVTMPQGKQNYSFPYEPLGESQDFTVAYGQVSAPGIQVASPFIIGANKEIYLPGPWRKVRNALEFTFDDSILPPEAYPYVIDPSTNIQESGFAVPDNFINDFAPDANFGTSVSLQMGDDGAADSRIVRVLASFAVDSIPAGSTITSVSTQFFEKAAFNSGAGQIDFHRIRTARDWGETTVTWNDYKTSNAWGTGGASNTSTDIIAATSMTLTLDGSSADGFVEWPTNATVVADVQGFIDGTFNNRGWIEQSANEGSGVQDSNEFHSSEYGAVTTDRPKQIIGYTSPPASGSSIGSAMLSAGFI